MGESGLMFSPQRSALAFLRSLTKLNSVPSRKLFQSEHQSSKMRDVKTLVQASENTVLCSLNSPYADDRIEDRELRHSIHS